MTGQEVAAKLAKRWPTTTQELIEDAAKAAGRYENPEKILDHLVETHEKGYPRAAEIHKAAEAAGAKRRGGTQAGDFYYWRCPHCDRLYPVGAPGPWCGCGKLALAWIVKASHVPLDLLAINKQSGALEVKPGKDPVKLPEMPKSELVARAPRDDAAFERDMDLFF